MANPSPFNKYILAYLCPTENRVVINAVIAHDIARAIEALKGQGVVKLGYWHPMDWASWGKPVSVSWLH